MKHEDAKSEAGFPPLPKHQRLGGIKKEAANMPPPFS
ncbi:hypothetical protein P872_13220 [Rhodonellum psychrophilum GCM71 = DSM 17998]|uniref:Uncharacterized protein n=1 Tax=Rhodonellum psychrophilum GCM71 = DSM 17998 TaxID=1123057 RepID=U5BRJ3_9BACT|nr:hypothetical protein P872_13220 [Rhodonellum psychrophilum GCM71 = DSM 17998]